MAPWPEQGNEPKAPDKPCTKGGDYSLSDSSKGNSGTTEDLEVNVTANKNDDKQPEDKNPDVSNLDDGQLKALLDEAITYKRPKDREGKSDLFRELLQEAEADESECGDGAGAVPEQVVPVSGSRYYSNSNRRRGRRDPAVSERQTRGGSLQNLVHAFNSEFDTSGFGYFGQSSGHYGGVGRRKSKRNNSGRDYSVSVSARQREGGSLPSNVNVGGAGGGMLTLSGLEFPPSASLTSAATAALLFDDSRCYTSKQNKLRKELGHTLPASEFSSAMPVHSSTSISYQVGGEAPSNVSKAEFMVVDFGDGGGNGQETKVNNLAVGDCVVNSGGGKGSVIVCDGGKLLSSEACSNGIDEEQGTEMEEIKRSETTRVPNFTSHATLEVGLGDLNTKNKNVEHCGDVDTTVAFPLGIIQCEKNSGVVNGVEQTPLQLPSSYNSVKCIVGSTNTSREDRTGNTSKGSDVITKQNSTGTEATKSSTTAAGSMLHSVYPMQHVSVLSIPPTRWISTSLGSGDDDKEEENKKHHGGRRQLEGGSSLIESRDDHVYGSVPLTQWRNFYGFTFLDLSETVSRLTFHGNKDTSGDGKNKSLDENGNAVNQNYRLEPVNSNDRKGKTRRMKTNNDRNVIMSQNIEGHRGDKDIESLIKFIESNNDTKAKVKNNSTHTNGPMNFSSKQQRNNVRRDEVIGGTRARKDKLIEDGHDEEKINKSRVGGKQNSKEPRTDEKVGTGGQLKKSNSLEEISKTKLEDLTSERTCTNSSASTLSSRVNLRRPKKQTTMEEEDIFSEKNLITERRSWGTEDSQSYYCSDGPVSADESVPTAAGARKRRGTTDEKRKIEEVIPGLVMPTMNAAEETEFHVVTKKTRRRKRRSSSGGRSGGVSSGHGGLFGEDTRRNAGSQYGQSSYQNRGDSNGYYQRKGFNSGNGNGFPPHDRMMEHEGGGVMLYQYRHHHRPRSPEHLRRKSTSSMPPSDKSDSSDLDSVHSLPVSSTTPKLNLDQTSTSSGSTPQASYADITRMATSNVSSSSSTQGSCSMNTGKWPIVTLNKNQVVDAAPTATTSTSTPTTTTISSSIIISYTSTITTTSNTMNACIAPTVSAPIIPNNPQFIGPRLNIGVPPVSGSKAASSISCHSNTNNNNTNLSPACNVAAMTIDMIVPTDSNQIFDNTSDSAPQPRFQLQHPELCTKKDATTSTTLDNKLMPSEEQNPAPKLQNPVNKTSEIQAASSNVIMDQYYPSLEESLVSDKVDRKPGRCSNNSTLQNSSNKLPVDENTSNNVVSFNVMTAVSENCLNKSLRPQETSDVQLKPLPVEVSVEATVIVPRGYLCTTAKLVSPEVSVASVAATVINRSKESMSRLKIGGRKLSAIGTNIVANSSVRPPVIIMDEQEQEASFRENIGTVSELTFGFEVNEQLLLSDGDENPCSTRAEPPSVVKETVTNTSPAAVSITLEENSPIVPVVTSSASEDFSARYRQPVTQQSDNHDLIVTFVGNAWDDVLKEMNTTSVQAGGKVQYYSGQ